MVSCAQVFESSKLCEIRKGLVSPETCKLDEQICKLVEIRQVCPKNERWDPVGE